MIRALAAGAAVALLAGAAQAKDFACSGKAEASNGAEVEVTFTVDPKGVVKARSASWNPPSQEGPMGMLTGAPALSVEYEAITEQGLGAPARITGFSMVMTDDRDVFEGAAMVFEIPDGRAWRDAELVNAVGAGPGGKTTMVMALGDLPEADHRELFTSLDALGRARLVMRRGDQVLKASTYDMADRATRGLFREAWAKAAEAAKKPRRCPKAG